MTPSATNKSQILGTERSGEVVDGGEGPRACELRRYPSSYLHLPWLVSGTYTSYTITLIIALSANTPMGHTVPYILNEYSPYDVIPSSLSVCQTYQVVSLDVTSVTGNSSYAISRFLGSWEASWPHQGTVQQRSLSDVSYRMLDVQWVVRPPSMQRRSIDGRHNVSSCDALHRARTSLFRTTQVAVFMSGGDATSSLQ